MYLQLSGEVVSGIQFRNGMDMTPIPIMPRAPPLHLPLVAFWAAYSAEWIQGSGPSFNRLRTRATDYIIFLTTLYYIILL
jgi:hypothetical protein